MAEFFDNPVAVGMSLFGLLLLVGAAFSKLQSPGEPKSPRRRDLGSND